MVRHLSHSFMRFFLYCAWIRPRRIDNTRIVWDLIRCGSRFNGNLIRWIKKLFLSISMCTHIRFKESTLAENGNVQNQFVMQYFPHFFLSVFSTFYQKELSNQISEGKKSHSVHLIIGLIWYDQRFMFIHDNNRNGMQRKWFSSVFIYLYVLWKCVHCTYHTIETPKFELIDPLWNSISSLNADSFF